MLMLVDYSSLLFRAYHSLPESVPMRGVLGFLNMLARLVRDRRPTGLGVAVDEDWRPAFRVEALPSYKAHRVAEEGEGFFYRKGWDRDLRRLTSAVHVGGRFETPAERETAIRLELAESKRLLEERLGRPAHHICYPWHVAGPTARRIAYV